MKQATSPPSLQESGQKNYPGRKHWITVCLLGLLLLTACGNAARSGARSEPSRESTAAVPETLSPYDDSLLSEVKFKGRYIEEGWQEGIAYDYRIPQILDDTPDAEELNKELRGLGRDAEEGRVF